MIAEPVVRLENVTRDPETPVDVIVMNLIKDLNIDPSEEIANEIEIKFSKQDLQRISPVELNKNLSTYVKEFASKVPLKKLNDVDLKSIKPKIKGIKDKHIDIKNCDFIVQKEERWNHGFLGFIIKNKTINKILYKIRQKDFDNYQEVVKKLLIDSFLESKFDKHCSIEDVMTYVDTHPECDINLVLEEMRDYYRDVLIDGLKPLLCE